MINSKSPEFSSQSFTIEIPTLDDAVELQTMHNRAWLDTYPNAEYDISSEFIEEYVAPRLSETGIQRRQAQMRDSFEKPDNFLRVAKDNSNKIIGFIDGHIEGDVYELDGLYTDKETYGSGLGATLWHSYLDWTDPQKDIKLTVATYNARARAFYTKIGFQDKEGTARLFGDTKIPIIDMILRR